MVSTSRLDELIDSLNLGPREWVLEEMQGLKEDMECYFRVREDLLADHEGDWVAIYHESVVGIDPDRAHLLEILRSQDIPTWRALITLINHVPRGWLPARALM